MSVEAKLTSGPEHAAQAERLLQDINEEAAGNEARKTRVAVMALAHAVLALGGDLDDWQPQAPPQPAVRPVETLPELPEPAQGGA